MVDIREATMSDVPSIVSCDSLCFPEEDLCGYTSLGAYYEDFVRSSILGYVAAIMGGQGSTERYGYITYLGVRPTHRKLGIAKKLMTAVENAMVQEYGAEYVSLHVRKSNDAAVSLYTKTLGYKIKKTEDKYYDDGEDASVMRKWLPQQNHARQQKFTHCGGCLSSEANTELQGQLERLQLC
ncbi:hypothetical protein MKW94_026265 [Papaver nudicaule]|uniref:N-acetyltransferase domain-containing protein n=1 Tax=Papaver nudicaule TaxID=74823 RepID=A0AA41RSU5_PAPNU|nr:hypothetical protein [Papaver nudicaule]